MEIKIRVRSRVMQFIALLAFCTLVWAYAQLEWGLPQGVRRAVIQVRGSIVTEDGSVLARSMADRRVYPGGSLAPLQLGVGPHQRAERQQRDELHHTGADANLYFHGVVSRGPLQMVGETKKMVGETQRSEDRPRDLWLISRPS